MKSRGRTRTNLINFELRQAAGAAVLSFVIKVLDDLSKTDQQNEWKQSSRPSNKTPFQESSWKFQETRCVQCAAQRITRRAQSKWLRQMFEQKRCSEEFNLVKIITFDRLACHGTFVVNNKAVTLGRNQRYVFWGSSCRRRH